MKKFSEYISENVFDNMFKRGRGDAERREDDINLMEPGDFVSFAKKRYTSIKGCMIWGNTKKSMEIMSYPHIENDDIYAIVRLNDSKKYIDSILFRCSFKYRDRIEKKLDKLQIADLSVMKISALTVETELTSGFTKKISYKTCIDFLDGVLSIWKGERINENVFDDMLSRSKGDEVRMENGVNFLTGNDFFEYLKKHYEISGKMNITYEKQAAFDVYHVPILTEDVSTWVSSGYKKVTMPRHAGYRVEHADGRADVFFYSGLEEKFPDIYKELKKRYRIYHGSKAFGIIFINPFDGQANNKFFLEIIDLIIDNVDEDRIINKK